MGLYEFWLEMCGWRKGFNETPDCECEVIVKGYGLCKYVRKVSTYGLGSRWVFVHEDTELDIFKVWWKEAK